MVDMLIYILFFFSDHKALLKPFNFLKNRRAPYNAVRVMYESGCAFSSRTKCMW